MMTDLEKAFSLFTTARYTSPEPGHPTLPIRLESVPLLDRHLERLRRAHLYFHDKDSLQTWCAWQGDEVLLNQLRDRLTSVEQSNRGDYRLRLFVHRGGQFEVQAVPAPKTAGPFCWRPSTSRSSTLRPLILDPQDTAVTAESSKRRDLRLFKTTSREIYDEASERAATLLPTEDHPEVLLHTPTHLLETSTSNIAILKPTGDGEKWITPRLSKEETPFLDGVMRQHLLAEGVVEEGDLSVEDYHQAKANGWRVIGFNGLRGVWEADLR